jgi:spore coat polysaccharide biosynthesis predicted glycosyltransferase SpsG
MRQLAIARDALARGADVFLVGSITGSAWLETRVEALAGLTWVQTSEDRGAFRELLGLQLDVALLDSYALTRADVVGLEEQIGKVASVVDGPWQQIGGRLGIAPVLDARAAWLDAFRDRFDHFCAGPEFVAIRDEVRALENARSPKAGRAIPEVVVALGGTGQGGHTRWVVEALSEAPRPLSIKVFSSDWRVLKRQMAQSHHRFRFLETGEGFLKALQSATMVVSALGTTSLELAFLRIPSVFIPVARNQEVNAAATGDLELGSVVDPNEPDRATHLVAAVERILSIPSSAPDLRSMGLDGFGARRVVDILLG